MCMAIPTTMQMLPSIQVQHIEDAVGVMLDEVQIITIVTVTT